MVAKVQYAVQGGRRVCWLQACEDLGNLLELAAITQVRRLCRCLHECGGFSTGRACTFSPCFEAARAFVHDACTADILYLMPRCGFGANFVST